MMRWSFGAAALALVIIVACSSRSSRPAAPAPAPAAGPPSAPAAKPVPPARDAAAPVHAQGSGSAAPASAVQTADTSCPLKPLPKGCPATPPNVNHPCSPKGIECTYVAGCCPSPVYVCDKHGHFEARFTRCN